jgi:hypothetical protein
MSKNLLICTKIIYGFIECVRWFLEQDFFSGMMESQMSKDFLVLEF